MLGFDGITGGTCMTVFMLLTQAIKEALMTLEPVIESAETQKENALNSMTETEAASLRRLSDQLKEDWSVVNKQFDDRFRLVVLLLVVASQQPQYQPLYLESTNVFYLEIIVFFRIRSFLFPCISCHLASPVWLHIALSISSLGARSRSVRYLSFLVGMCHSTMAGRIRSQCV